MRIAVKIIILLISLILQLTLAPYIAIGGIVPNIFLMALISVSLYSKNYEAPVYGLVFGSIYDFYSGSVWGLGAILCMYISYLCSQIFSKIYRESIVVFCLLGGVFGFMFELVFSLLTITLWEKANFLISLKFIGFQTIYNVILIIPIGMVVNRLILITQKKGVR
ncbi:MAG: rod shape-determining protein MreD [Clostridiaceae bacterium]|nr:rod shape-determining protein MreD [Clostridiaceae bacterium]